MNKIIIAVDFDGTIVTHEYPEIGKDIGAFRVLKRLQDDGHKIILYTMRSGKELEEAVNFVKKNGIKLYGVNTNPTQKEWTHSPKAYAHLYIDDAALGCPIKMSFKSFRTYVDWEAVEVMLEKFGILPRTLDYPEHKEARK